MDPKRATRDGVGAGAWGAGFLRVFGAAVRAISRRGYHNSDGSTTTYGVRGTGLAFDRLGCRIPKREAEAPNFSHFVCAQIVGTTCRGAFDRRLDRVRRGSHLGVGPAAPRRPPPPSRRAPTVPRGVASPEDGDAGGEGGGTPSRAPHRASRRSPPRAPSEPRRPPREARRAGYLRRESGGRATSTEGEGRREPYPARDRAVRPGAGRPRRRRPGRPDRSTSIGSTRPR